MKHVLKFTSGQRLFSLTNNEAENETNYWFTSIKLHFIISENSIVYTTHH